MTENKIQGKFYPLQHEEWLKACRELTPAQKSVLYYIRTLDPSGENPFPEVAKIAKALRLGRATVSRALKVLGQRQYIDWQPTSKDNVEQQVRDHLHSQLGKLVEVATPAARNIMNIPQAAALQTRWHGCYILNAKRGM